ncbi:M20 metallopeptidase family protein [Liquorilactobacillus mali]|uniref:M20 metallopeptidase family protein n=1 Tax=Liquorilactobacillus mali TaxID=1618 RepID=UPI002350C501|nr:amidohydrolase [Liquorilactobacillus mali]MDC7952881.1 amidohydrolase [Liquorilactobacillus mali]
MLLDELLAAADDNQRAAIEIRRYLHENPEPSYYEKETSKFIKKKLQEFGIDDIRTNVGNGFGIVAKIKGEKTGPNIAFRADFDALKITEKTDLLFKSKRAGVMHACGHDVHTASLLIFAKIINLFRKDLSGTVTLLFQNAEETQPGGAKSMVADGAMIGVDYVFGIHVNSLAPVGTIGYCKPFGTANSDTFKITIKGKSSQVSSPEMAIDPVLIASQIITNMQSTISRIVSPTQPSVLTFATVYAGNNSFEYIGSEAVIKGTVRTFHTEAKEKIKQALLKKVPLIANLQNGDADVYYLDGYPSIKQSLPLLESNIKILKKVFAEDQVIELPMGMGGEDFSYFSNTVPGIFLNIGAGNEEIGAVYPHHSPNFKVDEECIGQSIKTFLVIAMNYLVSK